MRCGSRPSSDDRAAARGAADRAASPSRAIDVVDADRRSASTACRRTQDAAFRRSPTEVSANFDRNSGANGTYTFTMRPNVAARAARRDGRAGAPDDRAPRQRAGRRRAEHRAAGQPGDQILVQLPGVTDVARAKEIIRSTGLLELKIVERARRRRRKRCCRARRQGPAGHGDRPGRRRRRRATPARSIYLVRKVRGGHRPRPAQRAAVARREQPAGGQLLAEQRGRAQVRQGHRRRTSAASSRSCSTTAS